MGLFYHIVHDIDIFHSKPLKLNKISVSKSISSIYKRFNSKMKVLKTFFMVKKQSQLNKNNLTIVWND